MLASLEHPNIATAYGLHNDGGVQFIAMELILGSTIETQIADKGLALDRLLEIGIPPAEAIAFAHGLRAFGKFKTDTAVLQRFAETYIESLDDDRFFVLFRTAVERTRHLRCVFGSDDSADADRALKQHISDNALGDGYSEEMIANVSVGHIDLKSASVVLPWVEEIVRRTS